MAISQVGGTETTGRTSGSTTLTINKPASVVTGNLLVAGITCDGTTPTPPSGWTEFGGGLHGSATWNNRLYYRFVDGTEGSNFTWTTGSTGPAAGFINAWSGVDATSPVNGFTSEEGTTSAEPNTGPSASVTAAIGRMYYARCVRDAPGDGSAVAADLTESSADASRRCSIGAASSTGNTSYTFGFFSADSNFSGSGTKTGLAISCNISEDTNFEATFALCAANEGTISATLPAVTSQFAGEREIPSGSIGATVPALTSSFDATHHVPAEGSVGATLPTVSSSLEGSTPVLGSMDASIAPVASFAVETRQFGEHIIAIEPDHRAFLVVDDGTEVGLKEIKRSQVTDA